MKVSPIIKSMRLRTLPLSIGGVVCGGLLATFFSGHGGSIVLIMLVLTACSLQVLSNLSNEMGDYLNGVDGAERQGPAYGMANGLTKKALWRTINCMVLACCVFGLLMVLLSFGQLHRSWQGCLLVALGAVAIWAATHYTLGKKPYGYHGWGDLFVFVFFGLVSVIGGYFVMSHEIPTTAAPWLAAVGMGLLSVAVLNVNNIRDMATDRGIRRTVPLRIGERAARWYQTALVVVGVGCFFVMPVRPYFMLPTLPFFAWHLAIVWRGRGRKLDPALPLLVLSACAIAVLYALNVAYSPLR